MFHPNIVRVYYNPGGKSGEKKRRARKWMEKSQNKIKQSEIDLFYEQEFNKQLTRNIKNM
jgi:hypothetical protein